MEYIIIFSISFRVWIVRELKQDLLIAATGDCFEVDK